MYYYKAICTNVVDGDTMDFDVDLGFHLTAKIRVRLLDIDTPEIYGKGAKTERELGLKVKDYVESILLGKTVILHTEKTGSFGRWLGSVVMKDGGLLQSKIMEEFPELG